MVSATPPKYVKHVLMTLEVGGFRAFLVGGCVRDMYMGRRPNDWDICTDALPTAIMSLFPGSIPTGIKHGTVTVKTGNRLVEVTTFRTEGNYIDHRRPENVSFISDLTGDLNRRDFTLNAIALSLSGIVFDPFGGRADIQNRLIRCVGEPALRFEEDALRMFRAIRLSATLGFDIDDRTFEAIREHAHLACVLSAERVRDEIGKMLISPAPDKISRAVALGLLDKYTNQPSELPELSRISSLPKNKQPRWAGLCAQFQRCGLIDETEAFLSALRLDGNTVKNCSLGVDLAFGNLPETRSDWKKLLARYGVDICFCAAAAGDILSGNGFTPMLKSVLKSGECFSLKRLDITGDDLMKLGYKGTELGKLLRYLLMHVLENPQDNSRDTLMRIAGDILQCDGDELLADG